MSKQLKTMEEIREAGLQALIMHLGPAGMIRFLQQFETGCGDYTAEREQWLGNPPVEILAAEIQRTRHDSNS